jgi:hypothetical protein
MVSLGEQMKQDKPRVKASPGWGSFSAFWVVIWPPEVPVQPGLCPAPSSSNGPAAASLQLFAASRPAFLSACRPPCPLFSIRINSDRCIVLSPWACPTIFTHLSRIFSVSDNTDSQSHFILLLQIGEILIWCGNGKPHAQH